jgi:hypothetical protein
MLASGFALPPISTYLLEGEAYAMNRLSDPLYQPPIKLRNALQEGVRCDVLKQGPGLSKAERIRISEQIAEEAVEALLAPLAGRFVNANTLRMNQPGYDYLVDNTLRLQVKGSSYVETVQFCHKSGDATSLPCLRYDVIIIVDIDVFLESNFGRLAKYEIPVKDTVDFYIVPIDEIIAHLPHAIENKAGRYVTWWKRPLNPNTKEYPCHCWRSSWGSRKRD